MAEVPDHLAPRDGLENAGARISEIIPFRGGGGCTFTVEFYHLETKTEPEERIGKLVFDIEAENGKPMASMFEKAHARANRYLRQMLAVNEMCRRSYERELALYTLQEKS